MNLRAFYFLGIAMLSACAIHQKEYKSYHAKTSVRTSESDTASMGIKHPPTIFLRPLITESVTEKEDPLLLALKNSVNLKLLKLMPTSFRASSEAYNVATSKRQLIRFDESLFDQPDSRYVGVPYIYDLQIHRKRNLFSTSRIIRLCSYTVKVSLIIRIHNFFTGEIVQGFNEEQMIDIGDFECTSKEKVLEREIANIAMSVSSNLSQYFNIFSPGDDLRSEIISSKKSSGTSHFSSMANDTAKFISKPICPFISCRGGWFPAPSKDKYESNVIISTKERKSFKNEIGTLLASYEKESEIHKFKDLQFYLYLVITDISDNRASVEAAIHSFQENFESYNYVKDRSKVLLIPFIAPVERENSKLTIENYSVTLARKIKEATNIAGLEDSTIAIYGASKEILTSTEINEIEVNVYDLSSYRKEEIARVIVSLRRDMTKKINPEKTLTFFNTAYAQTQPEISHFNQHVYMSPSARFKSAKESEFSILARRIFNTIASILD